MKYIVAFTGEPRAGKGTAAEPLVKRGFFKVGFGDAVYHEVSVAFGVKEHELRSHQWKTEPINLLSIRSCGSAKYRALLEAMGEDMAIPRTSRYHLQRWATEYRRSQDPLYWVKRADEPVQLVSCDLVFDDLRFPDTEYPYLVELARKTGRTLKVIEVVRPGNTHKTEHVSDKKFPFHLVDHVIENIAGYPEVLKYEVLEFLYPSPQCS